MKNILLVLLFFWTSAQATDVRDFAPKHSVDPWGNVSIIGQYQDEIRFRHTQVFYSGREPHVFLASMDSIGNCRWFKDLGRDVPAPTDITVVVDKWGYTYIAGGKYGDLVLGDGLRVLASTSSEMVFLAKYDTLGHLVWYRRSHGNSSTTRIGLGLDSQNNVYVSSCYKSWLAFGADTVRTDSTGAFIAKFDSGGNTMWIAKMPGTKQIYDMKTDAAGNCYLTGSCKGIQICDTQVLTHPDRCAFMLQCGADGVPKWQRLVKATNTDAFAVALGKNETPVMLGHFNGFAVFNNFPVLDIVGSYAANMYLLNYDDTGREQRRTVGHSGFLYSDISINYAASAEDGNIYISSMTRNLNTGGGVVLDSTSISSSSPQNVVIGKFDTTLDLGCFIKIRTDDFAPFITVGPDSSLYVSGYAECFQVDSDTIYNSYTSKIYVAHFDKNCNLINVRTIDAPVLSIENVAHLQANDFVNIYPNPTGGKVNVQFSDVLAGKAVVFIRDMIGRVRQTQEISQQLSTIDITSLPPGLYMAEIVIGKKRLVKMLTKQ